MKNNTFYSGLDFQTKSVVDKRLYIDGLTTVSLTKSFGANGVYATDKIFTFNTQDEKFYMLINPQDVLNPQSWKKLTDSFVAFPEFNNGESYSKGSCVMFTDSLGELGFYISTHTITAGQSPETHPLLWFAIPSATNTSNPTGLMFRQTIMHRVDPNDISTHDINIYFDKNLLPSGTSPIIQCYVDNGQQMEGYVSWTPSITSIRTWNTSSMIKTTLKLTGNLSNINFVTSDPTQMNVKVVMV